MVGKFTEDLHPRAHGKFAHVASGDVGKAKAAATKRAPGAPAAIPAVAPVKALEPGKVHSSDYGMHYDPANEKVVAAARTVPDAQWDLLPVQSLPAGTPIEANEAELKRKHIDKVVSGEVPFREGYVTKMWRAEDGSMHVVDGHHRVAMYAALHKDMPVRIMNPQTLAVLQAADPAVVKDATEAAKNPSSAEVIANAVNYPDQNAYSDALNAAKRRERIAAGGPASMKGKGPSQKLSDILVGGKVIRR